MNINQIRHVILKTTSQFFLKFQTFDCSCEMSPNGTLIGSFCRKHIKFQPKNTDESFLMTLKSDAKFEEKPICCFKNDKNFSSLKNLHFDWSLLCKVFNVWPKNVQWSYLSWRWRVMQNLRKNWLAAFQKTYIPKNQWIKRR